MNRRWRGLSRVQATALRARQRRKRWMAYRVAMARGDMRLAESLRAGTPAESISEETIRKARLRGRPMAMKRGAEAA